VAQEFVKDRIILHLCAKEGSDSLPYREAGYDVRIIGEDIGVENYVPPPNVYGIIANPPCTMFSRVRTTPKEPRDLRKGMELVKHCLRIIWDCQYRADLTNSFSMPLKFWSLENPSTGLLTWFLGKPVFVYNHSEYGERFSKRTALWGNFNLPKIPILFNQVPNGRSLAVVRGGGEQDNSFRSSCPINFAKAFYEANP
jgi:hypothetical protein